jgi:hypothetical protein
MPPFFIACCAFYAFYVIPAAILSGNPFFFEYLFAC